MNKSIVVGIDGTGTDSETDTNISKLLVLAEEAGATTIYRRGVGSHSRLNDKLLGGASGRGFNRQIRRAFQYLSMEYEPGDNIYLFGYSRGGAAAISLANLIWSSGICKATADAEVVREAMRIYGARPGYRGIMRAEFSDRYGCHHPVIRMVGLFDPVEALGVLLHHRLARLRYGQNDFVTKANVANYVSLLALDEHRWHFRPVIQVGVGFRNVRQVWVPGCHGDVGGGNDQPLSTYTLRLMVKAVRSAGLWLQQYSRKEELCPDDITSSWRFPYSRMRWVDRKIEKGQWVTGEEVSGLARKWVVDGVAPDTPSWESVAGFVGK